MLIDDVLGFLSSAILLG